MPTGLMRAARVCEWNSPLRIKNIPIPETGENDVLVRISACGLNGGDIHFASRNIKISKTGELEAQRKWQYRELPITIGHEGAGTIARVGRAVRLPLKEGDRVRIDPQIKCGFCRFCRADAENMCESHGVIGFVQRPHTDYGRWLVDEYREGSAAEYVKLPATHMLPIPDSLPFDRAAKLHALGVGYRACKTANLHVGDTVIVNAASGGSGVAALFCAKLFGASKVIAIGRNKDRLDKAKEIVDPELIETITTDGKIYEKVMQITHGVGADSLLDYSPAGAETAHQCILSLRNGGRAVMLGGCTEDLCITYRYIMSKKLTITGSAGWTSQDMKEVLALTMSGQLDARKMPILKFPLEKINEALASLNSREGGPFWAVLEC